MANTQLNDIQVGDIIWYREQPVDASSYHRVGTVQMIIYGRANIEENITVPTHRAYTVNKYRTGQTVIVEHAQEKTQYYEPYNSNIQDTTTAKAAIHYDNSLQYRYTYDAMMEVPLGWQQQTAENYQRNTHTWTNGITKLSNDEAEHT